MSAKSFSVLGVGTEITTGQIANTNAQWISKRLQELGAPLTAHMAVPDDRALILQAITTLATLSDVIFVTGGLGPTSDDFTRDLITEWVGKKLIFNEALFANLKERLASRNLKVREGHKQECFFPEGSEVLINPVGTAHGFVVQAKGKVLVALPGPPREIEGIWNQSLPTWIEIWTEGLDPQITASWDCMGLPESEVSSLVEPLLTKCPFVKAYRVHLPYIEFKLTYPKSKTAQALPFLQAVTESLSPYTGGDLYKTGTPDVAPENSLYFDFASTSPCEPQVVEAMTPYWNRRFGNSSNSLSSLGRQADKVVEGARKTIGGYLHCEPEEIVFTSGASESNNMALRGTLDYWFQKDPGAKIHFITANTEHRSVLNTFLRLQEIFPKFLEIDILPVSAEGSLDPGLLEKTLKPYTKLVSLMWVNNEIGALHPIPEIAKICEAHKVPLHVDATQAIGKVPFSLQETPITFLSMSAHKIYGPKGVGLAFQRKGALLLPFIYGGSHERGWRAGTLNVPGIVGMAKAFDLSYRTPEVDLKKIVELRAYVLKSLKDRGLEFEVAGGFEKNPKAAVPHVISLTLKASKAIEFNGLEYSKGSACRNDKIEMSHVLKAIHKTEKAAENTFRFSLGRHTTFQECNKLVDLIELKMKS